MHIFIRRREYKLKSCIIPGMTSYIRVNDLMTWELTTEDPTNNGPNYKGPKVEKLFIVQNRTKYTVHIIQGIIVFYMK